MTFPSHEDFQDDDWTKRVRKMWDKIIEEIEVSSEDGYIGVDWGNNDITVYLIRLRYSTVWAKISKIGEWAEADLYILYNEDKLYELIQGHDGAYLPVSEIGPYGFVGFSEN